MVLLSLTHLPNALHPYPYSFPYHLLSPTHGGWCICLNVDSKYHWKNCLFFHRLHNETFTSRDFITRSTGRSFWKKKYSNLIHDFVLIPFRGTCSRIPHARHESHSARSKQFQELVRKTTIKPRSSLYNRLIILPTYIHIWLAALVGQIIKLWKKGRKNKKKRDRNIANQRWGEKTVKQLSVKMKENFLSSSTSCSLFFSFMGSLWKKLVNNSCLWVRPVT